MTIYGHFPIIPFKNSVVTKIWEPQHDCVVSKFML